MNIYDFKVRARGGKEVALAEHKGKVILVVNTATGCGFTPQYEELQALYEQFHADGLEILDFPCNQFGNQAPGSDGDIHAFCTGRYGISFPQFAKIEVNGDDAIPLYKWLTANTRFEGFGDSPAGQMMSQILAQMDPDYQKSNSVKWNFTKFLIGRDGRILARFEPTADMQAVRAKIMEALS